MLEPRRPEYAADRVPLADESDIWANYDLVKVREAIRVAAGIFRDIDYKELIRDIYAARGQASRGRPR